MSTRLGAGVGYGVATVLVVAGAVLRVYAAPSSDVGWFAYTPLQVPPLTSGPAAGWPEPGSVLLVGAGLLTAAGTTGWLVGRRCGPRTRRVLPAVLAGAGARPRSVS